MQAQGPTIEILQGPGRVQVIDIANITQQVANLQQPATQTLKKGKESKGKSNQKADNKKKGKGPKPAIQDQSQGGQVFVYSTPTGGLTFPPQQPGVVPYGPLHGMQPPSARPSVPPGTVFVQQQPIQQAPFFNPNCVQLGHPSVPLQQPQPGFSCYRQPQPVFAQPPRHVAAQPPTYSPYPAPNYPMVPPHMPSGIHQSQHRPSLPPQPPVHIPYGPGAMQNNPTQGMPQNPGYPPYQYQDSNASSMQPPPYSLHAAPNFSATSSQAQFQQMGSMPQLNVQPSAPVYQGVPGQGVPAGWNKPELSVSGTLQVSRSANAQGLHAHSSTETSFKMQESNQQESVQQKNQHQPNQQTPRQQRNDYKPPLDAKFPAATTGTPTDFVGPKQKAASQEPSSVKISTQTHVTQHDSSVVSSSKPAEYSEQTEALYESLRPETTFTRNDSDQHQRRGTLPEINNSKHKKQLSDNNKTKQLMTAPPLPAPRPAIQRRSPPSLQLESQPQERLAINNETNSLDHQRKQTVQLSKDSERAINVQKLSIQPLTTSGVSNNNRTRDDTYLEIDDDARRTLTSDYNEPKQPAAPPRPLPRVAVQTRAPLPQQLGPGESEYLVISNEPDSLDHEHQQVVQLSTSDPEREINVQECAAELPQRPFTTAACTGFDEEKSNRRQALYTDNEEQQTLQTSDSSKPCKQLAAPPVAAPRSTQLRRSPLPQQQVESEYLVLSNETTPGVYQGLQHTSQTSTDRVYDTVLPNDVTEQQQRPPSSGFQECDSDQKQKRHLFLIVNELSHKVLEVKDGSTSSRAKIITKSMKSPEYKGQLWYADANGQIYSTVDDLAIDAANGQKATLRPCNGGATQQWVVDGKQIVNRGNGECLGVIGGASKDGAKVGSTPYSGASSQHWTLTYI